MANVKKSRAIPSKVVKLKRSAEAKSKIMQMYRNHASRLQARAVQPIEVNQTTTVIGTDDTWFNAAVIPQDPAWVAVPGANYVWNARDLGSQTAIISNTFRITRRINSARLLLSVDNYAAVFINGRAVVFDQPQNTPSFFNPGRTFNIGGFLRRGSNDIVIIAFNFGAPRSPANPAGVAASLTIRLR
ncbi:hypothetical protein [Paenibacillus methanolicus]|uniref:Glycosyl hydrolase family 2 n=1 Tax=Paenibacillus methanolicus TaxID=582686 RepID=A0A5S5C5K4_9BACL|nr:hypothetical protein [Paenibacillus methanolicus]TYP73243.1 hypothetical protein BCM02_107227 [Paenibacillus methanolicus]